MGDPRRFVGLREEAKASFSSSVRRAERAGRKICGDPERLKFERTTGKVLPALVLLIWGRVGLDISISASARMMVGSERGKDPNGLVGPSGGSDTPLIRRC